MHLPRGIRAYYEICSTGLMCQLRVIGGDVWHLTATICFPSPIVAHDCVIQSLRLDSLVYDRRGIQNRKFKTGRHPRLVFRRRTQLALKPPPSAADQSTIASTLSSCISFMTGLRPRNLQLPRSTRDCLFASFILLTGGPPPSPARSSLYSARPTNVDH